MADLCVGCTHDRHAHRHYRDGTECALCGCMRWKRNWVRTAGIVVGAVAGVLVIAAGLAVIIGSGPR